MISRRGFEASVTPFLKFLLRRMSFFGLEVLVASALHRVRGGSPAEFGTLKVEWLAAEVGRRSRLEKRDICSTVLLSAPRSGNHLIRFLVEYSTRRTTLGADDSEQLLLPGGLHDLPIYLRSDHSFLRDAHPIMVKRHQIKSNDEFSRGVLLLRDPRDSIVSHLRKLDDGDFAHRAPQHVAEFCNNILWCRQLGEGDLHVIGYDSLLQNPAECLQGLLNFLGHTPSDDDFDWAVSNTDLAVTILHRVPTIDSTVAYANRNLDRAEMVGELLREREMGKSTWEEMLCS